MVSVLASSAVDRGFEPWLDLTKDFKFGICCFSAKHAVLRRKSKDWLARNQDICPSEVTCLSADYKNPTEHDFLPFLSLLIQQGLAKHCSFGSYMP